MRSVPAPDLSDLARLAQNPGDELRPLLLRIHARSFADAPSRDEATCANFATLALGLIPLVTDDVLADTAALLRTIDGVPPRVTAALRARLAPEAPPPAEDGPSENLVQQQADLRLAADRAAAIGARTLAGLIERARHDAALGACLLERRDLGALDRAALFEAAGEAARDAIRGELSSALAASHRHLPDAPATFRDEIVQSAECRDAGAVCALLRQRLSPSTLRDPDLSQAAGRELFVLALVASGLAPDDCIRVVLTLDDRIARSVETVFRLAQVARSTTRRVAAHLVEDEPRARPAITVTRPSAERREIRTGAPARLDPRTGAVSAAGPDRDRSGRDRTGQADPRSRSTTNPGRT